MIFPRRTDDMQANARKQESADLNLCSRETVKKPMLLSKYNRAAGELEGARPASSWIIAIKNA